jgi:PTH1 family peptidyl-tRNA hydrolase
MTVDLVLGLGNPGEEYARTRHNAGFDVLAEVLRRRGRGGWLTRPGCELAVVTPGRMVVLARPLTYMNRSGGPAAELLTRFGFDPQNMLVVVDDIDLPLGKLRLRPQGGPGTHNGLRDLCEALGKDFPRLRVGIRGEGVAGDLADYVLGRFDADESNLAEAAIDRAADAVESTLRIGVEPTMNTVNRQRFRVETAGGCFNPES